MLKPIINKGCEQHIHRIFYKMLKPIIKRVIEHKNKENEKILALLPANKLKLNPDKAELIVFRK